MSTEPAPTPSESGPDRWTLIRDIGVLQVKLIVDGLRDFILVPVSLVAGIVSLLKHHDSADNEFYQLLRIGRKSERWINLFEAADRVPESTDERVRFPDEDIDALVKKMESYVVDEYQKGGVTRQALAAAVRQGWVKKTLFPEIQELDPFQFAPYEAARQLPVLEEALQTAHDPLHYENLLASFALSYWGTKKAPELFDGAAGGENNGGSNSNESGTVATHDSVVAAGSHANPAHL